MYTQYDEEGNQMMVEEPPADYVYTYADNLEWQWEERVELFKGAITKMAARTTKRQVISMKLSATLFSFPENKSCRVFHAPFDVRFPVHNKMKDTEITTVVQPDLCVVCDQSKIEERGCCGAPGIVIEILSPETADGNRRIDSDCMKKPAFQDIGWWRRRKSLLASGI